MCSPKEQILFKYVSGPDFLVLLEDFFADVFFALIHNGISPLLIIIIIIVI